MRYFRPKGFSLIELMIVVAIIGILAAIAIPAYRNYLYKARLSELLVFADSTSRTVNEYLIGIGATAIAANCTNIAAANKASPVGNVTTNVASWSISNACIVSIGGVAAQFGAGNTPTITLTPTMNTDGSVQWACGSGGNRYAPSSCP